MSLIFDGGRVEVAVEGVRALTMDVVRDAWERGGDGRLRRVPEPATDRGRAATRLSLDARGRPVIGWRELLWRIAGEGRLFDSEWARRDYGLDVEGAGLVVEGEWEPRRRRRAVSWGEVEDVVPVFPAWRARGVIVFDRELWDGGELREAVEAAGRGMYRVVEWSPCESGTGVGR